MQHRFWFPVFGLAGYFACNFAAAACTTPTLISPAEIVISEASPRLEWSVVDGAHHYLVWLESRVPEGRVLLTEEFQTGATYLIPPRSLTTDKATVRLRVTAVCKDNTQAALSTRFRIDEDKACALQTSPIAQPVSGEWSLHWGAIPQAQTYRIHAYAAQDGKPIFMRETIDTSTRIARLGPGVWMLAVEPVCKGLKGVTSWVALENPPTDALTRH